MSKTFSVKSPIDNKIIYERTYHSHDDINNTLNNSSKAQFNWANTPLEQRKTILSKFVEIFSSKEAELAKEITLQMGRPIKFTPGEIKGTCDRALKMIELSDHALSDIQTSKQDGFNKYIKKVPVGNVFVISAWNYPYLIAINAVVPALLAGNSVILKHSAQTPICAERFFECFKEAGLPENVFQILFLSHADTAKVMSDKRVDFVAFTGSVEGGKAVQQACSNKFINTGLELGGKDPAYVMHDAKLDYTIESLVDGSFFNSGQSCCGIERIYVHKNIYKQFIDGFVELTYQYKVGNPLDIHTTLGPLAKSSGISSIKNQIDSAIKNGANALIDEKKFEIDSTGVNYMAPQVLINVNHDMKIMTEETFGPVVGIMQVDNDDQAIKLMNDSQYGLTASIWSQNINNAISLSETVQTGTCFVNRCDYLDPELAWTGIKDTGKGCTLSVLGLEQFTRPKSFHIKHI